jgi:hypothetical protein
MFSPISIPYGAKMLFNEVRLKPGVSIDDVELTLAEMCNVVKDTYGDEKGGFIAGQVFRFSGFISDEGSVEGARDAQQHLAIVTYWKSYEQHEASHADRIFRAKFAELAAQCSEARELGYEMLWQGVPEHAGEPATGANAGQPAVKLAA